MCFAINTVQSVEIVDHTIRRPFSAATSLDFRLELVREVVVDEWVAVRAWGSLDNVHHIEGVGAFAHAVTTLVHLRCEKNRCWMRSRNGPRWRQRIASDQVI